MVNNEQMKQFMLSRIQDRLRRFVSVKEELVEKYTNWFQALVQPPLPPPPAPDANGGSAMPPELEMPA